MARARIRSLMVGAAAWVMVGAAASAGRAAQPPLGLARDALARRDLRWIDRSAPGLRVHFLAGTHPAHAVDRLVRQVVAARAHDLSLMGLASFDTTLDVFFVESRPQIESLVGMRCTGLAVYDSHAVFLMENAEWRSFERHEIMHVLAQSAWGEPAEPSGWINEGWAQFADGACACCDVDTVFAAMAQERGVIPLARLVPEFRNLPDLDAYLEATSVVGYVYRRGGLAAVRTLWQRGVPALGPALGVDREQLEREWRAQLPVPDGRPSRSELARIRRRGCG